MSLIEMSVTGGVMALAVLAIRALLLNRLPKAVFVVLWALVALRLLVPFAIPSPTSVSNLIGPGVEQAFQALFPPSAPSSGSEVFSAAPDAVATTLSETTGSTAVQSSASQSSADGAPTLSSADASFAGPVADIDRHVVVRAVWVLGALGCSAVFVLTRIRFRREFAASLPVEHPMACEQLAAMAGGLRRHVQIRQSDRVAAPLTYGVLKPVVLIPKTIDWTDKDQVDRMRYVLAHELVHIRRFDNALKVVLAAVVCLHWFNPAAWAMYLLANRDIELACDESVVHRLGTQSRAAYARSLISMEETKSGLAPLCSCSAFSKTATEERVVAIMHIKHTSMAAIVASVSLAIGIPAAFATTSSTTTSNDADGSLGMTYRQRQDAGVLGDAAVNPLDTADWRSAPTSQAFTDQEWSAILALNVDGFANMTLAEAHDFVQAALADPAMASLVDRFAADAALMNARDTNGAAAFVFYVLGPLSSAETNWSTAYFGTQIGTAQSVLLDGGSASPATLSAQDDWGLSFDMAATVSDPGQTSVAAYLGAVTAAMEVLDSANVQARALVDAGGSSDAEVEKLADSAVQALTGVGDDAGVLMSATYFYLPQDHEAGVFAGSTGPVDGVVIADTASNSGTTLASAQTSTAMLTEDVAAAEPASSSELAGSVESADVVEGTGGTAQASSVVQDVDAAGTVAEATAVEGTAADGVLLTERLSAFEAYGVTYDVSSPTASNQGKMFYKGVPVSVFVDNDVRANADGSSAGTFFSWSDDVTEGIKIRTVRAADGTLTGIEQFTGDGVFTEEPR